MQLCRFYYPELEEIREPTEADLRLMNRKQRRDYFRPVKSFNKKSFPHGSVRFHIGYAIKSTKKKRGAAASGLSTESREYMILAFYVIVSSALTYLTFR